MAELKHRLVDTPIIRPSPGQQQLRDETPEQAAKRLQQLEKQAYAVHYKILRAYKIDPAPDSVQAGVIGKAAESIAQRWDPQKFPDRIWTEEQTRQVKKAITKIAQNYFTGFGVQNALRGSPDTEAGYEAYSKSHAASYLINIFMNHLTNAAEARLMSTGMDAVTAHGINRYIIRESVCVAQQNNINNDAHIEPRLKDRPTSPDAWEKRVDYIRHYWKNRVPELEAALKTERTR